MNGSMKKIFLAGSRKFSDVIQVIFGFCKNTGIEVSIGRDSIEQMSTEAEENAHKEMLRRIGESDIIYVVTEDGYIGRTVALEIGYAIGKNKEIISSNRITEVGIGQFISRVMTPEELVKYVKDFKP